MMREISNQEMLEQLRNTTEPDGSVVDMLGSDEYNWRYSGRVSHTEVGLSTEEVHDIFERFYESVQATISKDDVLA